MKNAYSWLPIDRVTCPFCSYGSGNVLYQVTSDEAARHFISPWRNAERNARLKLIIERLWAKPTCQLIQCGRCTGVFAFPFVGGDADFYQVAYEEQKAGSYPADRWEYGESVRFCDKQEGASLKTASCLEIGAGDGAFVKRLINAGVPQGSITALEYSSYGQTAIRSTYKDVNVRHGEDFPDLPPEAFSHAFLFQVLEHLGGLDSFLSQLHRCLKRGGWVFIGVPNPARTEFNELSGLLLDMPPNHISRFTDDAVKSLSSRKGFLLEKLADQSFSWRQMVPQYLQYRYMRLAQNPNTIPARIDSGLTGTRRKVAAGLFAMTILPKALLRFAASGRNGNSRLIVLRKSDT